MGEVRDRFRRANRRQRIAADQQLKALDDYLRALAGGAVYLAYWPISKLIGLWHLINWRKLSAVLGTAWAWCARASRFLGQQIAKGWLILAEKLRPHRARILFAVLVVSVATLLAGAVTTAYVLSTVWNVSVGARIAAALMLVVIVVGVVAFVVLERWPQISEMLSKAADRLRSYASSLPHFSERRPRKYPSLVSLLKRAWSEFAKQVQRVVAKTAKIVSEVRMPKIRLPALRKTHVLVPTQAPAGAMASEAVGQLVQLETIRSDSAGGVPARLDKASPHVVPRANSEAIVGESESEGFSLDRSDAKSEHDEIDDGGSLTLIELSLFSAFELSFCVISIALLSLFSIVSYSGSSLSAFPEIGFSGAPGDARDPAENNHPTGEIVEDQTDTENMAEASEAVVAPIQPIEAAAEILEGAFDIVQTPTYWRSNSAFEMRNSAGDSVDIDDLGIDYGELCRADIIVAVGAASPDGSSLWNFDRAQRRARSIAQVAVTAHKKCGADVPVVLSVRGEGFIAPRRRDGRRVMLFGVVGDANVSSSILLEVSIDQALRRDLQVRVSSVTDLISEQCLFLSAEASRSPPAVVDLPACRAMVGNP